MAAMRLIDREDFQGTQKVRMIRAVVAGQKPRAVGDIVELPAAEAYELICALSAEPFVEGPRIHLVG